MFWNKKQEAVEPKWQWGLLAVFAVTMFVNSIAGATKLLGGQTTAAVSDSFPNLFAPSGLTFSIWGVIYLLFVGFIVYVFGVGRPKKSPLSTKQLTDVTKLLTLNLALNALWIVLWQYKWLALSVLVIVGILVTLLMLVEKLRTVPLYGKEYVLAKLPFSIYAGWITVATVANVTAWLVSLGWKGGSLSEGTWMVAILLVAAAIGLVTTLRNRDTAYLAVFVWAYAGILLKHLSPHGFDGAYPSTIVTLTILLAVFVSVVLQLIAPLFSVSRENK